MFILTPENDNTGVFSVSDNDGIKSLCLFVERDDAERYAGLLEADDYPRMKIVEVGDELVIKRCEQYNYQYVIINSDDFVIPPREYAVHTKNKI